MTDSSPAPLSRRRFLSRGAGALLGLTGAAAGIAVGVDANLPDPPVDGLTHRTHITEATQAVIEQGIDNLVRTQLQDGSYGDRQYRGNVAVTSLAALALMAGGHQPGRGAYGKAVLDALKFVLAQEDPNKPGFLNNAAASPHGPMYGHGFATLFLAEVHGMVQRKELRKELHDKLKRAVDLIINTQNKDGGWRYLPQPLDADLSVTVCQIMALRAAHNAGLSIPTGPKSTVERCIEYVVSCQEEKEGGFRYVPHQPPAGPARTAAGIVALNSAGVYLNAPGKDPEKHKRNRAAIEKGLNYLMEHKKMGQGFDRRDMHYFYGHYYAAQAMWTAGEPRWSQWFPIIRDELVGQAKQRGDGSWSDQICTHYATAMALLILQIPNNYLSIFQK